MAKPGRHHDRDGLYLQIRASGSRSWLLVYMRNRKQHYLGLGSASGKRAVSLDAARKKATAAHELIRDGIDPLEQKRADKRRQPVEPEATFKQAAEKYVAKKQAGWRNSKTAKIWLQSFALHVYPVIGDLPVGRITTDDVEKVLTPVWNVKPSTGARLRYRMYSVLRTHRPHDNPAHWELIDAKGFPKPTKVRKPKRRASLPYADVPAFLKELRQRQGVAARALEWTILTAARTNDDYCGMARHDLESSLESTRRKMKADVEHVVPLSAPALALLKKLPARKAAASYSRVAAVP